MTAPAIDKFKRVTGDTRTALSGDMRKQYEAGDTIRAIADQYGRSATAVRSMLQEAGTTLRPRGGNTRGPRA